MTESTSSAGRNVRWFAELGLGDVEQVGGKNSSLGEMVSQLSELGIRVPNGFATTADAYRRFIGDSGLADRINQRLGDLDTDDVQRLAAVGQGIRAAVVAQPFPVISTPTSARHTRSCPVMTRAPSRCDRARPQRTCPTRPLPASRRPSSTCGGSNKF